MAKLHFICPKCGKSLRLGDASLLGRRGKCPSCFHRFVLENPVEDEGERAPAPADSKQPLHAEPPNVEVATQPTRDAVDAPVDPPLIVEVGEEPYALRQWKRRKRKSARRRVAALVVLCLIGLICAGLYFMSDRINLPFGPKRGARGTAAAKPDTGTKDVESSDGVLSIIPPTVDVARAAENVDPISLLLVPSGARIVIHLHPADIWNSSDPARELQECLGPLALWAEEWLHRLCLFEPVEIDEVTICLVLGSPARPLDVSAVVRLNGEVKRSALLARFEGRRVDDYGHPVYVTAQTAYLIHDLKTFAVAPRRLASEMVAGREAPNPTGSEIEALLRSTDRTRHFTVVFYPDDALQHREMLVPSSLQNLLAQIADWLNPDEVECVAWSIHDERLEMTLPIVDDAEVESGTVIASLDESQRDAVQPAGGAKLTSTLLLRNRATVPERRLARQMHAKLNDLPGQLLRLLSSLKPQETGRRSVIGRFPAMLQVVALSTDASADDRLVRLSTSLPERAAPNLALAAVLTWEESQRNRTSSQRSHSVNR